MSDYRNYEPGSVTSLINQLGWHPLQQRREVDTLCLFKKGIDNHTIRPLDPFVKPTRETRHMYTEYNITSNLMPVRTSINSALFSVLLSTGMLFRIKLWTLLIPRSASSAFFSNHVNR